MKKIILPIVILALLSFSIIKTGITDSEREFTTNKLIKSQELLQTTIEGLSDVQLNFKPTPESWSVAECVEHLAISEGALGGLLQVALKAPADASKRDSVSMTDEQILGFITDRSTKVKTFKPFEPSGKFGSNTETLVEFNTKREAQIEYLKTTEDDLRNHYAKMPFGTLDGVQVLLFISGHTERHVAQMEEVKSHSGFPKE